MGIREQISDAGEGFAIMLNEMPRWFRLTWQGTLLVSMLLFMLAGLGSCAEEVLSPMLPATQERLENAKRKVEMERLRLERISLASLSLAKQEAEKTKIQAEADAHVKSLGLPDTKGHDDMHPKLSGFAAIITGHLSTIVTLMFAGYLLPTFARTGNPTRLVLNISVAIVLAGIFALATGALSPTVAAIKLDIFSIEVSSSSIASVLVLFGAVLSGFCHYSIRHAEKCSSDA